MTFQALIATMHQQDYTLLERMNLQSDAVIVNQCSKNEIKEFRWNGYNIIWIDSMDRGLSKSRNLALKNATADICLLCDDDEVFKNGYQNYILDAYKEVSKADMIIFNIEMIDCQDKEELFKGINRVPWYKTYGSVHLSFKRKKIMEEKISFHEDFGTGSSKYSSGEDSIFCMEVHKKRLKIFTYPKVIAAVSFAESSWFKGYNEKYFYDIGAYLSVAYPKLKRVMQLYYPYRFRNKVNFDSKKILEFIEYGMDGYRRGLGYEEYLQRFLMRKE